MRLTDYYRMEEVRHTKSHRFDCTSSTGSYDPFEAIAARSRGKNFFFYYNGVPDSFNEHAHRRADKAITNGRNISSVFTPYIDMPLYGFGDTKNTSDALLFVFSPDYRTVEIYVARGLKNHKRTLFELFVDGELTEDMQRVKERAHPTSATPGNS